MPPAPPVYPLITHSEVPAPVCTQCDSTTQNRPEPVKTLPYSHYSHNFTKIPPYSHNRQTPPKHCLTHITHTTVRHHQNTHITHTSPKDNLTHTTVRHHQNTDLLTLLTQQPNTTKTLPYSHYSHNSQTPPKHCLTHITHTTVRHHQNTALLTLLTQHHQKTTLLTQQADTTKTLPY